MSEALSAEKAQSLGAGPEQITSPAPQLQLLEREEVSVQTVLAPEQLELVLSHLNLPHVIAKKVWGKSFDRTDLEGEGNIGLIKAALDFDPNRGVSFKTYASKKILGRLYHALRDRDRIIRPIRKDNVRLKNVRQTIAELSDGESPVSDSEIAARTEMTEMDVRHFRHAPRMPHIVSIFEPVMNLSHGTQVELIELLVGSEDHADSTTLAVDVEKYLTQLPSQQAEMLRYRFGIRPYDKPHSQKETAEFFHCGQNTISVREKAAKKLLRLMMTETE